MEIKIRVLAIKLFVLIQPSLQYSKKEKYLTMIFKIIIIPDYLIALLIKIFPLKS